VSVIDTSVAGLGGCPYAKTQSGNACTEDVVFVLHHLGVETGVDAAKLKDAAAYITKILNK
jgi:hydroxymethylglutaryl-CoA lyase